MSATAADKKTVAETPQAAGRGKDGKPLVRSWTTPILLTVFALLSLGLFAFTAPDNGAEFRIATPGDLIELAAVTVPAAPALWILTAVMLGIAALAWVRAAAGRKNPVWLNGLYVLAFVAAFLIWVVGSADNNSVYLTGLIAGSFALAVPLIFGSMAGILSERSGVINIAIEGQLLAGAFTAAMVGSATGSAWIGLASAVFAGVAVSFLLAVFSIKYLVNQVIVGVVLNVLVIGLTSFLFSTVLAPNSSELNSPPHFESIRIPFLAEIPIIGRILFDQSILGYGMYLIVALLWIGLFRTRWGLRVRAVGEHPKAADTVGIDVIRTRYVNVLLGGAVAGMGGAFFTLVSASSFSKEMTAGQGFIALAAVIFGRWNPIGAFFAALLFGFATNMQYVFSILGTPVPSQFMAMLPYVVTVFAVAGLVGRSRGPAAGGTPYVKE